MIKPDLILIWPYAFDFPYTRALIMRNRKLFNKVIISFTPNSVIRDFRKFLKKAHPDFTFVENFKSDWYNDAVNAALDEVESKWVMFMEQDFVCDDKFLKELLTDAPNYDFLAYEENMSRLHLCCMITKMSLIKKTHRYFGITQRYKLDCFDFFMAEVELLAGMRGSTLQAIGYKNINHLNGLVQNYNLIDTGRLELLFRPEEFKKYNKMAIEAKVIKDPKWLKYMKEIDARI